MIVVPPVAKLLIVDSKQQYLMLYRSAHPTLPAGDPDIAGGLIETGESPAVGVVREALEETGVLVPIDELEILYQGVAFSSVGRQYTLYQYQVASQPAIELSWEHQAYEWLPEGQFVSKCQQAADRYMGMVASIIAGK